MLVFSLAALAPRMALAQVAVEENLTLSLSASSPQAGQINVTWPLDLNAISYTVYRSIPSQGTSNAVYYTVGDGTTNGTNPAKQSTGFTDTDATPGVSYQYQVVEQAEDQFHNNYAYTATGFVGSGSASAAPTESRGKAVLVVDNTYVSDSALQTRLQRLEQDLVGDGWTVVRHDVARDSGVDISGVLNDRGAGVLGVKHLIYQDYVAAQSTGTPVRAVFLFGHVPVPYSGNVSPDGDSYNHRGAWPCDLYYGDMYHDSGAGDHWTDTTVNITTASDVRNYNVPNDGKFDQSTPPGAVALEVGRVDFANIPNQNSVLEEALLEQYLDKDHNYRQGYLSALPQARLAQQHTYSGTNSTNPGNIFGQTFVTSSTINDLLVEPYTGGLSNYLADTTVGSSQLSSTSAGSFQWSSIGGDGSYTGIGIVGTNDFLTLPGPQSLFYELSPDNNGSQFGDWDRAGDLMRAALGSSYGLASDWENPSWNYTAVASGSEIGIGAYNADNSGSGIWPALMGDPTLRMQVVTPASGLLATDSGQPSGAVTLTWNPTPDPNTVPLTNFGGSIAGYNVYRAPGMATAPTSGSPTAGVPVGGTLIPTGPFVKLNTTLIANSGTGAVTYQDTITSGGTAPDHGTWVYQVRAVDVVTSGSSAYESQSQGIFQDYIPSQPAPTVKIIAPANFEQPNGAIYNPTNGALLTAPTSNITVSAIAVAQGTATIKYVDFYINASTGNGSSAYVADTYLGRATSDPYKIAISSLTNPGLYWLTAIATDSNGRTTASQTVRLYVFDPLSAGTVYNGGLQDGWIDGTFIYPFNATAQGNAITETGGGGSITFKASPAVITLRHAPINTANYSNLYLSFTISTAPPSTTTGAFYPTIQVSANEQNTSLSAVQIQTTGSNNNSVQVNLPIPMSGYLGTSNGHRQFNIDNITITDVDQGIPANSTVQPITISNISLGETGRRNDRVPSVLIRTLTDNAANPPIVTAINTNPPTTSATFYSAPHNITLLADAADPDASIAVAQAGSGSTPEIDEVDLYDSGVFVERGTFVGASLTTNYSSYQFALPAVSAGTHTYTVTALSTLGAMSTSAPLTVTVYNNVGGTVNFVSPAGTALPANATVTATETADVNGNVPTTPATFTFPVSAAATGPDGNNVNFQGTVLPPGTYTFTAAAPTYVSVPVTGVSVSSTAFTRVDFTNASGTDRQVKTYPAVGGLVSFQAPSGTGGASIPTGATVTATQTADASGNPITGTPATATFPIGATAAEHYGNGNVNYEGGAYLTPPVQLPAGTYTLTAAASGYVSVSIPNVVLTNGAFTREDFTPPAQGTTGPDNTVKSVPVLGGLISGKSPAGTSDLAGATIQVRGSNGSVLATYTTTSASVTVPDGSHANYVFPVSAGLTAGTAYTLHITASGYITQDVPVTLQNGVFTPTDVTLLTLPEVEGYVTDKTTGQPVKNATVTITDASNNVVATLTTGTPTRGADGNFINYQLSGSLQPGTYTFTGSDPTAYYGTATKTISPAGGTQNRVDLALPSPPTLQGYVTDVSSGAAITGATVTATQTLDANGNVPATPATYTFTTHPQGTGADGKAINYNGTVVAGTYTLVASVTGYVSATTTGVTATVGAVTRTDFPLAKTPNQLGGLVTDAGGNPVSGATVTATLLDSNGNPTSTTTTFTTGMSQTGPDGNPVNYLQTIVPGTYTARATTAAGASPTKKVVITANQFTRADFTLVGRLASVSVNPTSETGGTRVSGVDPETGTVTLQAAAPTGGETVTLTSSDPSHAAVPATVTVPAGQTSATFPISTTAVQGTITVAIGASLNGDTASASLTLTPVPPTPTLSSLTVSPSPVMGGTSSTGTVTLSSAALTGGFAVSVSSSSGSATVTSPVIVPAGQATATFAITTTALAAGAANVTATISASAGSVTKTSPLVITAPGVTAPTLVSFTVSPGSVTAGHPATGTVTLSGAALTATSISLSSDSSAATVPASVMIAQGQSSATFTINSGTVTSSTTAHITATLSGTPITQPLTVTPNAGLSYPKGLNMISLPYNYSGMSLASVFGFSPVNLYVYNPTQFNYNIPTTPTTVPPPGQGFFIYFPQATTVTQVGIPVDQTQPYSINLSTGWNQIGDPFLTNVTVSSLSVRSGTTTVPYSSAGSLVAGLYGYTPNGNYYAVSAGQQLVVGQGYWLYATRAVTLIVPAPAANGSARGGH